MGEYEAYGYKLCLGMKDNSESASFMDKEAISTWRVRSWLKMNIGGMVNTCKSDGEVMFPVADG